MLTLRLTQCHVLSRRLPQSKTTIKTVHQCSTRRRIWRDQSSWAPLLCKHHSRRHYGGSSSKTRINSLHTTSRIRVTSNLRRNCLECGDRAHRHFLELRAFLCKMECIPMSAVHNQESVHWKQNYGPLLNESAKHREIHCDPCRYLMECSQLFLLANWLWGSWSLLHRQRQQRCVFEGQYFQADWNVDGAQ